MADVQLSQQTGVIIDPPDNVVVNFLKFHRGCIPARCWTLELFYEYSRQHQPQTGVQQVKYAWDNCLDPFWMLWFLDLASDLPGFPADVDAGIEARDLAIAAVGNALNVCLSDGSGSGASGSGPLGLVGKQAADDLQTLQDYIDEQKSRGGRKKTPGGGKSPVAAAHLAHARMRSRKRVTALGGPDAYSCQARAAAALSSAFGCASGDRIDVADQAWSLATEAYALATAPDKTPRAIFQYAGGFGPWWTARKDAAKYVHDLVAFDGKHKELARDVARTYATPPYGVKNTDHVPIVPPATRFHAATGKISEDWLWLGLLRNSPWTTYQAAGGHMRQRHGTIFQPAASTPPGNWSGTVTLKSGTWVAYGTDDGTTPTSRSAWVTDTNSNQIATGSYTSPPGGYTWAFSFTGLSTNQTVNVNVQWNYATPTPSTIQSVAAVVTGST